MRPLALLLMLTAVSLAHGSPLTAKNGNPVNVSLAGKRERGIGLRAQADGWRLELRGATHGTAEVVDVTRGVSADKWRVAVEDGALMFDAGRFVAGHAYRVDLRSGGSALIYLYPPASGKQPHSVVFADSEAPLTEDGIAITPKSAL